MYEIDPKTMFGVVWLSLNTTILILYGIYPLLKNNCLRTREECEPKQEPEYDTQDEDEAESDASTVSGLEGSEDGEGEGEEEEDEREWKKTN